MRCVLAESDIFWGVNMDMRDHFAAAVLPAVYSNEEEVTYWCTEYDVNTAWKFVAERAYEIADAMMEARQRKILAGRE